MSKTYKMNITILQEHEQAYKVIMAEFVKWAKEKELASKDVLVHPVFGPTAFVGPAQKWIDSEALMKLGERGGDDVYSFAQKDGVLTEAADKLAQEVAEVLGRLTVEHNGVGVFNLPAFIAARLGIAPQKPEDFRMVLEADEKGQPKAVYFDTTMEVDAAAVERYGVEETDATVEEITKQNEAILQKLGGGGGDSDAVGVRDEVDVVVKRAK